MSKITELQEKVASAAERVEKAKKTIERHEVQAAKKLKVLTDKGITQRSWKDEGFYDLTSYDDKSAVQDYEGKLDDIKGATRKLKEVESVLAGWQAKLNIEIEKERFINEEAPKVIVEFLNRWKEQARGWYIKAHVRYIELKEEFKTAKQDAEARYQAENPNARKWGKEYDAFMKGDTEIKNIAGAMAMMGAAVATMATYRNEEERLAWLERLLEEDRKAKLIDLIHRINAVVGTITDAAGLSVSQKGNLDGIIIGEQGKAKIETIGAGGYNIQCFHYRTLVHPLQ